MKKLLSNLFMGELLFYTILGAIALVVFIVKQLVGFVS